MKTLIRILLSLALTAAFLPCRAQKSVLRSSVTYEKMQANGVRLPVIGELVTQAPDINKQYWWSIGCETLDRDYADFDQFKDYFVDLGIGYARIQSGWAKTEKEKGKYDFAWLDHIVDGLIERGVKPWMCLCYSNPIYGEGTVHLGSGIFTEEETVRAWKKNVEVVAKRYKGKIWMYEVWNEPSKSKENIEPCANLYINTAESIRKHDKKVPIAAFGLDGLPKSTEWIKAVFESVKAKGKASLLDKLTFHAYFPCPETSMGPVKELEATVQAIAPQVQLLQGESGCPSQYEFGCAMKYLEWTEYSQAKWNLRRMLTDFSMGLPASIFSMVDVQYKGYMLLSFGLLRCDLAGKVRYARPSFYAVRNLASIVTADFHPSDDFTISYRGEERISAVGLSRDGKTVGVFLWFSDNQPGDCLERKPVSVSIDGIDLSNTVYVDPVLGTVHNLSSCLYAGDRSKDHTRYHNLPLWDCPVLIINQSYLKMKK
jgi:hypothetical protein